MPLMLQFPTYAYKRPCSCNICHSCSERIPKCRHFAYSFFSHILFYFIDLSERSMTTYGRLPLPFTVRKAWRGWIPVTRGSSGATCTPLGRPAMKTMATAIFRDLAYSCFSLTSLVCSRALLIGNMYQSSLVTVTISEKETLNWFLRLHSTINTCCVDVIHSCSYDIQTPQGACVTDPEKTAF